MLVVDGVGVFALVQASHSLGDLGQHRGVSRVDGGGRQHGHHNSKPHKAIHLCHWVKDQSAQVCGSACAGAESVCRCARVSVCRCARVSVCRCARVSVCRCARVSVCRCVGQCMQVCRGQCVQVCKDQCVQVCKGQCAGV